MNTEEELQNMLRVISCGESLPAHAKKAPTFLMSCAFATDFGIASLMILTRWCDIPPLLICFLGNVLKKIESEPQSDIR